ncbi:hypothetical protein [Nannocystis radixulma]|uniref:Uncharacterized protein n=1 Tax=Nannocystis radixulma TaxID=2995305 RepID=A0ABT5AZV3_9BACT|nr:hypothetical protein [Nannocystis radixulma]MDC0666970.1 hypothetical protein [Nannocystis radixulma]
MTVSRRAASLVLSLSFACQGQVEEPTETAAPMSTSTSTGDTSSTGPTTGATTTAGPMTTPTADECDSHAIGDWGKCQNGNQIDNTACGWQESGAAGMLLCLAPTSGGLNVCGIRDCVDVCDCFAPPTTGTAVPVCAPILGSGANGCALYCAGGQICPDGMVCQTGYCYWEN